MDKKEKESRTDHHNNWSQYPSDQSPPPKEWYAPQHHRYYYGELQDHSHLKAEQKKNKAHLAVYLAVAISVLFIIALSMGVYFLVRHFDRQTPPPIVFTEEESSRASEEMKSSSFTSTAAASETITETRTETKSSAAATESETTIRPSEFDAPDFVTDPYGRILNEQEIEQSPRLKDLYPGISPAAQASLAYFAEREAFELAFDYFSEIALKAEFNYPHDNMLHRWNKMVTIEVRGVPTVEDLETLDRIIAELNAISVLPEIRRVPNDGNYIITFCLLDEMPYHVSGYVDGNWGFVTVYWDSWGDIISAEAAVATDVLNQTERNHIILEEFVQGFGMLNDSYDYIDSIFQQEWTTVQDLMPLDWAVIRILYHPPLQSGMAKKSIYQRMITDFFE